MHHAGVVESASLVTDEQLDWQAEIGVRVVGNGEHGDVFWGDAGVFIQFRVRGPAGNMTVLAIAYDPDSDLSWPVDWLIRYEGGTVYNSSMGHLWKGDTYPEGFRCIAFETTLIRAIEWLGSGKVTYALPAEFPGATQTSLRPTDYYSRGN